MRKKTVESLLCSIVFSLSLSLLFVFSSVAGQWTNPKEAIGDPNIARLQHGKKELTDMEKEEIKKYGFTGLELMTYLDANNDPGEDNQYRFRRYVLTQSGNIIIFEAVNMRKYYYKNYRALITHDAIKPGDIQDKLRGFAMAPPDRKRSGIVLHTFLRENIDDVVETGWRYDSSDRRASRRLTVDRSDSIGGSQITQDDWRWREPWEEDHKILGDDTINGHQCFVVASTHRDPKYYLSKRITWIEKHNFIDPHEEQFDKESKLYKIIDKEWKQIEPSSYWVKVKQDYYNILTEGRTLEETFQWIFNQHPSEDLFNPENMKTEIFWGEIKQVPRTIRLASDLPPKPESRAEFLKKLELKTKSGE